MDEQLPKESKPLSVIDGEIFKPFFKMPQSQMH